MSKDKSVQVYRPTLSAEHILFLHNMVDTYRNTAIMSGAESVMVAELLFKLTKEKIKISVGLSGAYGLKPESERVRTKSQVITAESLGGGLSDQEKLDKMTPKEQELFWAKTDIDYQFCTQAEYEQRVADIEAKYAESNVAENEVSDEADKYSSGVIPTSVAVETEVKETSDSELYAAMNSTFSKL